MKHRIVESLLLYLLICEGAGGAFSAAPSALTGQPAYRRALGTEWLATFPRFLARR